MHKDSILTTEKPASRRTLILVSLVIFLSSLLYFGYAAVKFPTIFNLDNHLNFWATRYIAEHQTLPAVTADDPQIKFSSIGTTRLTRPPLTFIVSAAAYKASGKFVSDRVTRYRLGSPLIAALTLVVIFLGLQIGFRHLGLAILGTTAVAALPKFLFLASCNNDDIGAIFSTSLLFTTVLAIRRYGANRLTLIGLACAVGLVLQTKFTAWLTLPWFGLMVLPVLRPVWRDVVRLLPLLLLVSLISGGWWLLFNMINYGIADPTGLSHAAALQAEITGQIPNRRGYQSTGVGVAALLGNHDQFLTASFKSLIGYLEWIELEVGILLYWLYGVVFLVGLVAGMTRSWASMRKQSYFDLLLVLLVLSQCVFYLHHNLVRDIQPQARYILPAIMPLIFLFLSALYRVPRHVMTLNVGDKSLRSHSVVALTLIVTFTIFAAQSLAHHIRPVYKAKPFHTLLKNAQPLTLTEDVRFESAEGLIHRVEDNSLVLERTPGRQSELVFSPEFCDRLPLNGLLSFQVSSPSKGGLHLRIDRSNQGSYRHIVWQGFPAGQSFVVIPVKSDRCSGVKLTLADGAYQLTLSHWQIRDLRIHEHGYPL